MAPGDGPSPAPQGASRQEPRAQPRAGGRRLRLPGVPPSDGAVTDDRQTFLPPVAFASSDGQRASQGQGNHGSARPAEVADGSTDKRAQPGTARLGQLLPLGK